MIRIDHVTMRFGRAPAVDNATLDVEPGECVALWGANGAGKTTLLRCVLGLLRFRGRITLGGRDVRRDGKRARMLVGYVPQELGFDAEARVHEAIAFFARLKGVPRVRTEESLSRVGIGEHAGKRIRELSGGMKQRLALAIALLGDPPVLVLDEVTASLDALGRRDLLHLLEGLSGQGRTMLFASHRVEEVVVLARRVAMLERGALVRLVDARELPYHAGHGTVLHLLIREPARDDAVRSLREGGFAPTLNGVGVLVPVAPERKAAPFRVLADAQILVDDFEIVSLERSPGVAPPEPTP